MRVVHCKKEHYTHYIGRPSTLGNPYPIGSLTRAQVIALYEEYVRADERLLAEIRALPDDAVLGCWCSPQPCHGGVIVKLHEEYRHKR